MSSFYCFVLAEMKKAVLCCGFYMGISATFLNEIRDQFLSNTFVRLSSRSTLIILLQLNTTGNIKVKEHSLETDLIYLSYLLFKYFRRAFSTFNSFLMLSS